VGCLRHGRIHRDELHSAGVCNHDAVSMSSSATLEVSLAVLFSLGIQPDSSQKPYIFARGENATVLIYVGALHV